MKNLILALGLALFVVLPTNVYGQEKPKLSTEKTRRTLPSRAVKTDVSKQIPMNETPKLNTVPVKLTKKPTLNRELYKNVNALKKVDVSDTRDKTDKTVIETVGAGGVNRISISGKEPDPNTCNPTPRNLDIKTSDFGYFTISSVPDFIKPGVVINYSSIIDGRNTINTIPRNPLTLYLVNTSAIPGLDNLSVDIANPQNVSGINNALGNLTGKLNTKSVPANMNFEITEINSEKSLQYAVTGSYSGPFLSAQFGVSGENFSKSYYYLIKFTQNLYNVAADPNTVSFVNALPNSNELAYVSEVTYGRKGLMMIKTNKSMSEIKAEMKAKANYGIQKGEIGAFFKSVNQDRSSEIRVFFYGGSSGVATQSIQESDMKRGFDNWVYAEAGNGLLALPISYKVKNLKGEQLMLSSVFKQNDMKCVPKKDIKLKVTLLDLQCIGGRDGGKDNPDDYGLQQYIVYKANGKEKTFTSRSINVFQNRQNGPVQVANQKNILISGDATHQLQVKQNRNRANRGNGINNSLVFTISHKEFMDPTADFRIYTWLKEYTKGKDKELAENIPKSVKIKDVIELLLGVRTLNENTPFPDGQIGQSSDRQAKFHTFGQEYLMLAHIQKVDGRYILEGPIKLGDGLEKAATWIGFELIE